MKPWYAMDLEETAGNLQTDLKDGLTAGEAAERLARNGPNELIERGVKSPWKILLEQFTEIMVVILLISAAISIWLHETTDAIVILIIVVLNALLGFTQEYRAEKAMAALKKLAVPKVHVRRGGHLLEIPAREVVPGDLIQLEAGDVAPADGRLVESANLRLQESVLTGESEPVEKFVHPLGGDAVAVGDQRNMVFMGTVVTYGRGQAVITATGMNSELGKIADLLQSVGQEATPLQKRLQQLGKGLALAALGIVAVVFLLGLARGEDPRTMFQTAISMAVAAVPEGLPAVVTIALAFGAQRMLKRNALIRKLPAVETLGSTTVICSDKTGTLTENRMTVTVVDVAGNQVDFLEATRFYAPQVSRDERAHPMEIDSPAVLMALLAGALCNDAVIEENSQEGGNFTAVGDPTEGALVVAAARAGLWKADLEKTLPRVAEFPFDSERKRMTTAHPFAPDRLPATLGGLADLLAVAETGRACLAFTKGSVDGLLEISTRVWNEDHVEELDAAWRSRIEAANAEKAAKGMRVLGIALRLVECEPLPASAEELESDLVFVGLVGMIDPARPEVRQAVSVAKAAGVRPVMITGDHPLTAMSIARELGISDGKDLELTGKELATLPAEELQEKVARVSVYARVSPEHKLKIVQALQASGQIVAMTGDGVNDAPALKKADIGVAMGITGTDVSKEAADMVLLDDNFTTIVAAIEEGRRIYDNIRKFIKYTLTSNAGEIWVMLAGPFLGLPLPLTALQILWVNLVTDGLPGLALTAEPAEPDTMRRAPHPPDENIFSRGLVRDILWIGLLMAAVSLGVGLWAWWSGRSETWQTMVFTTLTLAQMGNVLAIRSDKYSLFQIGLLSNKALLGAVLLTFLLQMAVIYVPFLQAIFQTQPLPLLDLVVSLVSSLVVFVAIELVKWVGRRQVI